MTNFYKPKKSLLLFALLFLSIYVTAQVPCFSTAVQYTAGGAPNRMTTADFNNDGIPDLAVANFTSNTISVFLGSGAGTFGTAVNYICGSGPLDVYSADFNGDGNMDLATANSNGNNISILLGTGFGVFGLQVTYGVGSSPNAIYSADFNGDGKQDLAVSNLSGGNISVLMGVSLGTFSTAINYNVGSNPRGLSTADFNGDGNYDIAVANAGSNDLSILFGSPTGTFATAVNYAAASGPYDVLADDFNSDGNMDLAVPNLSANNVSILLGSSTGTFAAAVNYTTGASPSQIVCSDFNGDGKKDLATSNTGPNTISVLLGSNTGTFAAPSSFAVGASIPRDLVAADFNLDGVADIATANNGSNNMSVLLACSMPGASAQFDGVNDYVDLGSTNNLKPSGAVTAEAWAYRANWSGTFSILGNPNNAGFAIRTPASLSNISAIVWRNGAFGQVNYPLSNLSNGWHHFALTYDGRYLNFYIDGLLIGTNDAGANYPITYVANNTLIGAEAGAGASPIAGRYFNGKIDEVRIWNVARDHCQIQTFMNAEIPTSASGLAANYHFNHGTSGANNSGITTLSDATGNGNNGTLTNFLLSGINSNWIVPGGVVSSYTTAVAPTNSLNIVGNGNNVVAGSTVPNLSNFTDFGSATTRTFTAQNVGTGTLYIGNITFSGANASQFTFTSNASSSITTAGSSTFGIVFTPTAIGTSSAIVSFPSNDCTHPTYSFVITASATTASALNFDGTSDYVNCGTILSGSYTKEAWINLTSGSTHNNIMSGGAGASGHAFYIPSSTGFRLSGGHNGSYTSVMDPTPLVYGTWYHVAISYNVSTGTLKLYKNGVLVSSANSIPAPTSSAVTIGWFDTGSFFKGSIDEVRLWNTERTACEIQTYMNCEIPTSAAGLVANYHFNQGLAGANNSTTTLLTDAAASNTGTLISFGLTGLTSNWIAPGGIANGYTTSAAPTATLNIVGNGNNILAGSTTPTVSNFTDFGSVTTRTFTAQNVGTGTLYVNSVTFSGANASQFTFTSTASSSITTAGSSTFGIIFTPTALGTASAIVNISSNDCANPTFSFVITASATTASALNFDGVNDYVVTPSFSLNNQSFTIEFWAKRAASGNVDYLFSQGLASTNGGLHVGFDPAANQFHFGFYTNDFNVTAADLLWHHWACVYNNSTAGANRFIYKDGVLVGSNTSVSSYTGTGNCYIGTTAWNALGDIYGGSLDEMRIWNVARSQCEIQDNMNCEIPTTANGLLGNYHFNQGIAGINNSTVTSLTDLSGNAKHGTLTNFSLAGSNSNWISQGGVASGSNCPVINYSKIDVQGNSTSIPNGSPLGNPAYNTSYINSYLGGSSTRTFVIFNTGTASLSISNYSLSGLNANQYTITSGPSAVVAPSGSTSIVVTFSPTSIGTKTAAVNIVNNDCGNSPFTFVISGIGLITGEALNFDGVNDYVETNANITELGPGDFTIETWIKTTGISEGILACSDNNASWDIGEKSFYLDATGVPTFVGWGNNYIVGSQSVNDGNWHHVAVTWDWNGSSGVGKMFIDGQFKTGSVSYSGASSNYGTFKIAKQNYNNFTPEAPNNFNGTIDELRIWNVPRTECEIQTYMNAEITSTAPGLSANYHFNEGILPFFTAGYTTLPDASGNAYTGTLTNMALTGTISNWVVPGGVVSGFTTGSPPSATLVISSNGNNIPIGIVTNTANNTDFGTNAVRTFSATNTGTNVLFINGVTFTGVNASQFSFTTTAPSSVTAGGTNTFAIIFTPTALGTTSAIVNVSSNDCANPTYSFVITASATPASALNFDGINNYVQIAHSSSLNAFPLTVETWIKTAYTGTLAAGVVSKYVSNSSNGWLTYLSGGSLRAFYFGDAVNNVSFPVTTTVNIADNNWHHTAFVVDANGGRIYIDGVLSSGVNAWNGAPTAPNTTQPMQLGAYDTYFPGSLDEVRIWNTARTQCQIQTYMNAEITSTASGLIANYQFNQGIPSGINTSISNVIDAIGLNNGTLNGFVLTGSVSNFVSPGAIVSGFTTTSAPSVTLNMSGNGNNIPVGITTNTTNFTDFATNTSRTFSATNTGTNTLYINSITFTGANAAQFSVNASPANSLAASASSTFSVLFTPTAVGTSSAIVNIVSNDCATPNYSFVITASASPASTLRFNGSSNYVQLTDPNIGTSDFCVEGWFKTNTTAGQYLVSTRTSESGAAGNWWNVMYTGGTVGFEFGAAAGVTTIVATPSTAIATGTWNHFAAVRNGNAIRLYINGLLLAAHTETITRNLITGNNSLRFGAWPNFGVAFFNGEMDEIRIWNTARTQCQIQTFMNAEITSTASGLVANYHFNQGIPSGNNTAVNTLIDAAGANTGSLLNFALTGTVSNFVSPGAIVNGFTTTAVPSVSLSISGNGNNIPVGIITTTNNFTDFGTNTSRTFSATNTGTNTLYINSITFTGANAAQFSVNASPASSLAASASSTFSVLFTPTAVGTSSAIINIVSNDCATPSYSFVITATATAGSALNFDGVNDYAARPIFSSATNNITMEAKVFWNGPSAGQKIIVYNGNTGGNGYGFFIPSNSSSVNWLYGGLSFNTAFALTPNQWTSLAMVITNNLLTIYKDGILTNSITIGNPAVPLGGFSIGSDHLGSLVFNGSIDEVRFWNRPLCQSEIQNNLNCEIATTASSLLANYHFNQGIASGSNSTVTTLFDASGNTNSCIVNNFGLSGSASNWVSPGAVTSGSTCSAYLDPEINLVGNGNNIPDGNSITSAADNTDFGNVSASGNIVRTYTIQNTGAAPLTVSSITLSGANATSFTVGALSPSSPISASSSAVFSVTYTPVSAGTHTATINISSNDCDESNYDFIVSGTSSPGSALILDGVNDYVNCGAILPASYTKEAWIKLGASLLNGNNLLSGGSGSNGHALWAPGSYSNKLSAGHNLAWNQVQDPTALNINQWYHVAVTYDAASLTMNLYKNGVLVATNNTVQPFSGSDPLSIGAFSGNFSMNGSVDEVRVWSRPLCQAEIQNNMNCEIPTIANGLIANYHFNQGVGFGSNATLTALSDVSGSANTATLTNIAGTGTTSNWVSTSTITTGSSCVPYFTPEINLLGNGVSIPDDAATPSLTNHTSFSTVCVNASLVRTYTIQNTGSANLTVTAITVSGPDAALFTIGNLTPASPITPSNQAVFSVTFIPTAVGIKTATIDVANNDCNEGSYDFAITGTCNALPTVTASASSSIICNGQSTILNGLGANTYTWTGGITNGVSFSPTVSLSYTVTGTNTLTGCTSTNLAVQSITVNPNPTVTATSPNTVICFGGTVTLNAVGANTYTWNPGGIIGATITPSPNATTVYSVSGTSSLSCASTNTATITVSVNPLPSVSITAASASVCLGNSTSLTASGANTYTWNPGTIIGTVISVTPNVTGSYSLVGTSSAGCTSSNSAVQLITVNSTPTVAISTNTNNICLGSSASFSASGAVNYTWNPGVLSGSNISVSPTITTTYSLIGTDAIGCLSSNISVQTITVNSLPTVSAAISNSIICFGSTTTISAIGANTYTWNPGALSGAVISVTPNANTSYTLIGENLSGCTNTNVAIVSVIVNALPSVTANSTSLSVCAGASITLSGSGANTYTWTNGILNNVAFVPLTTNTYVVSGTDVNGCQNTASITVSVGAMPTVSASTSNSVICFGGTLTLNGSGATSYTWSGNAIDNVPFSPTISTTYSLSGSDAGCTSTNQAVVSITVNALPTVSATVSNTLICEGQTLTVSGLGASTYSWSNGLVDNVVFTPSVSSTYTVVGTNSEGCRDSAFVNITINTNPTLTVVSSNSISCDVLSATLTVTGASTYTWNTSETVAFIVVTPSIQTTYTVEGLGTNGCINTATFVQIVVCDTTAGEVKFFSGFTPNGDGVNDFWKIDNITEYPKNRVTLFNRWGQKIYDVKGYDNLTKFWPTSEEASKLLSTTYYYIIDLDGDGKKLKKGWVELIK